MSSRRERPDGVESSRCQYANKKCHNPRTLKRDGTLHTLCEVHKRQTNTTQRRYSAKKSKQRREESRLKVLQRQARDQAAVAAEIAAGKWSADMPSWSNPITDVRERRSWSQDDIDLLKYLLT
ncbi:unnamed protein product [Aphanomyces euteiches]